MVQFQLLLYSLRSLGLRMLRLRRSTNSVIIIMYSLPLLQKSLFIVINKIETNEIEDLIGEHILLITELLTCYCKRRTQAT